MKTEHTKAPWEAPGRNDDEFVICTHKSKGKRRTVANAYSAEDAAHIVRCVNHHDELVEALKYIAGINGNLGTVDLENKCGPNDGIHRGIKLKACIKTAQSLLAKLNQSEPPRPSSPP